MSDIKIIGIDLDGTLFNDFKEISAFTADTLKRAYSSGIIIVPVTGRPLSGIPKIVTDLPFIKYIITSNGAVIYEFKNSIYTKIYEALIDHNSVLNIISSLKNHDAITEIFTDGKGYLNSHSYDALLSRYENTYVYDYLKSSRSKVDDIFDYFKLNQLSAENIAVTCKNEDHRNAVANSLGLGNSFNIVFTTETGFEIGSKKADKGIALSNLCSLLNIPSKRTAAFGDSHNDIGMLKYAGLSFAMAASKDNVIKAADHIAASNNCDGVAYAIDEYIL